MWPRGNVTPTPYVTEPSGVGENNVHPPMLLRFHSPIQLGLAVVHTRQNQPSVRKCLLNKGLRPSETERLVAHSTRLARRLLRFRAEARSKTTPRRPTRLTSGQTKRGRRHEAARVKPPGRFFLRGVSAGVCRTPPPTRRGSRRDASAAGTRPRPADGFPTRPQVQSTAAKE